MPATKTFEEIIRDLEEKYGFRIEEPEQQPGIREMRKVYRPRPKRKAGESAEKIDS